MISRAAQLPRICLACRLRLPQRTIIFQPRCLPTLDQPQQRRLASDFCPQSKERIEALISGALDDIEADTKSKHAARRRGQRRGKGRPRTTGEEELAEWELVPVEESVTSTAGDGENTFEEMDAPVRDNVLPETVPEGKVTTALRPDALNTETFRHDLVNRQSLGVDALGKPVEAIIIKNPNKMKKGSKQIPLLEEERATTGVPLDWQAIFPQDVGESHLWDEVWQNIEEIRPQDTKILKRKEFDKLKDRLVDGFTQEQLVTYLNHGKWDDVWEDENQASFPWIVKQSSWTAVKSNQWGALKRKEQQAVLILSAKWKLEIQEHIEGLGRAVIWLPPNIFQLITRPSNGVVDRLSNNFLDRSNNERISTKLEECRIGIYSRKSAISTILNRLDEIVQTISSQHISVKSIAPENLTEPVLDELARITKTALRYDAKDGELSVSWLAESDLAKSCESSADVVLRLLVGRHLTPHDTQVYVLGKAKPSKSTKGGFLTHQREKRDMSWRDKLRQWHRYVNPVGKSSDMTKRTADISKSVILRAPETMAAEERNEVVATFGNILHAEPNLRAAKSANIRRVLSPRIPHPAALTQITADAEVPSTQKTAIVLHFAPDMASKTPIRKMPEVRLHIPIHPFTDLSHFTFPDSAVLEALIPWHQTDVMLPEETVDVRITQTRILPLDTKQTHLQGFLNSCDFNLLQGKLRTPSRTTFSIPEKCVFGKNSATLGNQDTDVPYMFMGLEIHQTIEMEWQGHTLRYSSIEAGQHGGQQQKISLVKGKRSGDALNNVTDFLRLIEAIATGAHVSWDEGYKLMQERSDEQFSWDMMDTEGAAETDVNQVIGEPEKDRMHHQNDAKTSGLGGEDVSPEDVLKEGGHPQRSLSANGSTDKS